VEMHEGLLVVDEVLCEVNLNDWTMARVRNVNKSPSNSSRFVNV
jgi:hypothetical protein